MSPKPLLDRLTDVVRKESLWMIMFSYDIMIWSNSREQVETNLENWRYALERR